MPKAASPFLTILPGFRTHFALLKTERVRVSREAGLSVSTRIRWMDRMSKIPRGLSLAWEEPVAGDRRIIDRKLRKAFARPCQPFQLSVCAPGPSFDYAQVVRLEVRV